MKSRRKRLFALIALLIPLSAVAWVVNRWKPETPSSAFYSDQILSLQQRVSQRPQDASAHYAFANAYSKDRHWLEAIEEYESALARGLDTAELRARLAYAFAQLGYDTQAIREYLRAMKKEPGDLDVYVALAKLYGKQKAPQSAADILRLARKNWGVGKTVLCRCEGQQSLSDAQRERTQLIFEVLATQFDEIGDAPSAMTFARHLTHVAPKDPGGYAILGIGYFRQKRFGEAISYFRRAVALSPQNGLLHYWLGVALMQTGSSAWEEAARHLQEAVRLTPNLARAYYHLGQVKRLQKRYREAARAFAISYQLVYEPVRSLELSAQMSLEAGDELSGRMNMGLYYRTIGKWSEALREFQAVLKKVPQFGAASLEIAQIYQARNDTNRYLEWLKKAIKQNPSRTDLQYQLAETYVRLDKRGDYVAALKKMARADPKNAGKAYSRLAYLAEQEGRFDEAESHWQKCIQTSPSNGGYYRSLGQLYLKRSSRGERLQKAIDALEAARILSPDDYQTNHLLGIAYTRAQRLPEAAAAFRAAINLQPGFGEAYLNLGQVYQKLGEKKRAQRMFAMHRQYTAYLIKMATLQTRVRQNPKHPESHYTLGMEYLKAGDLLGAKKEFEMTIRLQPRYLPAYEQLAPLYGALAQPDAEANLRRQVARLKAHPQARAR